MKTEYFTIYWLDGKRQVVSGNTIEDAFTNAGYGAGAVSAVDWFDKGITDTHWYSKEEGGWVKCEALHIHHKDLAELNHEDILVLMARKQELRNQLIKHKYIQIDFENGNCLTIDSNWGCYHPEGWVEHIRVMYCEKDFADNSYYTVGTQCFSPARIFDAIDCLMIRSVAENPAKEVGTFSTDIQTIAESQPVRYL